MSGQEPGNSVNDKAGKGDRQTLAVDQLGDPVQGYGEGGVDPPEDDVEDKKHADDRKIPPAQKGMIQSVCIVAVPTGSKRDRDHDRIEQLDGTEPGPMARIFSELPIAFIDLLLPSFTEHVIHVSGPLVISAVCLRPFYSQKPDICAKRIYLAFATYHLIQAFDSAFRDPVIIRCDPAAACRPPVLSSV